MKIAVCALLLLAERLCAQYPLLTSIPAGNAVSPNIPAAIGPNGGIWIAGINHVMRLDRDGRPLFTTRIDDAGAISALAVNGDGIAAVTTTDYQSSHLIVFSPDGRITATQKIPGIPAAIVADDKGNVFVTGRASDGFVGTSGAYKSELGEKLCSTRGGVALACDDAFILKLRLDGTLLWATLCGGSLADSATAIALDPSGSVWIAGETISTDLPVTPGALQSRYGGGEFLGPLTYGDAFLARIDPAGARLESSTYLGGSRYDRATTITATATGVLVAGVTDSPNFPVTSGALQRALANPTVYMPATHTDSFVAFVSNSGALIYSTYYGEEGPQTAAASAAGPGGEVAVSITGSARRCLLRLEVKDAVARLTPDCFRAAFEAPFTPLYTNNNWVAVGHTKPGLNIPGITRNGYVTAQHFAGDNPGPGVIGIWNDDYPAFRPVIARDSYISIYFPIATNLNDVFLSLGGRNLTIVYAANNQINALVPVDIGTGTHPLTIGFRFFTSIPVPVDVIDRWPGLASAALNQDGSVNSAANPADRGTVVSLFGSGFGPLPLPVIEPYILSTGVTTAQGMELLFSGRVADGLFQFNARIPSNAVPGHTPVRIVMRLPDGSLSSNLAKIFVR